MTALATSYDCELRLGRALSSTEARRVDVLLADASATIRAYTGQTISQDTTTDRVKVRRTKIRLPQRPVTAVDAIADRNGTALTYTWLGGDEIQLGLLSSLYDWAWEAWSTELGAVDVTYTHGHDPIPDDVVGVCASVALRALGQTPTESGFTARSIEGYSEQFGSTGAAGPFGLLPDERFILDRYRRRAGYAQGDFLR